MSINRRHIHQVRSRLVTGRLIRAALLTVSGLIFLAPARAEPPPDLPGPTPSPTQIVLDTSQPIQPDPVMLNPSVTGAVPTRLIIPRLAVDLPIVEAPVVDGFWELSDTSASHGVGSASPGDLGNIVIFAHARPHLFLPLRQIKPGDTIYVLTAFSWHTYQVDSTTEVFPNQVEVLAPTPGEVLTLFTCSGFADSRRLLVTARPVP